MADTKATGTTIPEWQAERTRLNDAVMDLAGLEIKRFWSLDGQCYRDGEIKARTKEMLGLVASLVLRCDDCILYHTIRCKEEGLTDGEFQEVLSIGLIVGGSIVIPHLRRAVDRWNELRGQA